MKNLLTLCVLFTLSFSIFSCGKSDTNPTTSTGSVNFKVDSTTNYQSSVVGSVWESTNSLLNITSKGGKSIIVINLVLPNGIKTGTYSFSASSGLSGTFYRPDTSVTTEGYYSNIDAKSFGTLAITSMSSDSLITGTFSFTLKDPVSAKIKKITTGTFTKVKVVDNKSITTGGTNTFSAKIDGTLWSPKQITAIKSFGSLNIVASDGTKSLSLTIIETAKAGTYTMDFLSGDYKALYSPSLSASNPLTYVSDAATSKLTISEHNTTSKRIKGTFNFKGADFTGGTKTYLITEGAFDATY